MTGHPGDLEPGVHRVDAAAHPHTPDAFESYGVLLLIDATTFQIQNASTNAESILGECPTELIGTSMADLLDPGALADIRAELESRGDGFGWLRTHLASGLPVKLDGFTTTAGQLGIDIVPVGTDILTTGAQAIERVAQWSERLLAVDDPTELLEVACEQICALSGYDGAWACRIEPDGHGVVVAAYSPGVSDTVGQMVLATDMAPAQPRLRGRALPFFVADLEAAPVGLQRPVPAESDFEGSALLRPYPAYLDRLVELGVRATLSVPLTVGGRVWGRIIAHHRSPRRVPPAVQSELRLLGAATSTHLTELLQLQETREQLVLANRSARVLRAVAGAPEMFAGLVADPTALLELCGAASAIVSIEGENAVLGDDLEPMQREQILALARDEFSAPAQPPVVARTSIPAPIVRRSVTWVPGGFVAVKLGEDTRNVVVWIRPERRRAVTWVNHSATEGSGEPLFADMTTRVEHQRGACDPWSSAELSIVADLRVELAALTVDRYQQLAQRATALTRSNAEFNAFAHTAAHDLKQPIRGIRQYTEFFLEDTAHKLDEDEQEQLRTILRLSSRMTGLIDTLMSYAELGDASWRPQSVALRTAVDQAVELLPPEATESMALTVEDGVVRADPTALRQLLLNLVDNAIKYTDGPARVEVSLTTLGALALPATAPHALVELPPEAPVLTVRDHGIGIPAIHHEAVFGLFRKLNKPSEGSGAGLALCRRIAQRHGGEIWLVSEPGIGTTVHVALGEPAVGDATPNTP
ncbi:MAG: ATP-binding protein [Solirubrobacteraceae bacterium]|nr:ATP-binding protein [Patulibacter sp.]